MDTDPRTEWLADPKDLHYRGELAELGVRVADAIEQENSDVSKAAWLRSLHAQVPRGT